MRLLEHLDWENNKLNEAIKKILQKNVSIEEKKLPDGVASSWYYAWT
jgi:hypothetical protein